VGTSGTRLRVGLIGAGLVGQAAHAFFLWDDRGRFELAALADPSAAVRAAVGDRYGIPERHESLAGMLGLGLDAVVVSVPDAFHADVACQALEAGLHVLCEELLALTVAGCNPDRNRPQPPSLHRTTI
jgi:predicted dehydrogenase